MYEGIKITVSGDIAQQWEKLDALLGAGAWIDWVCVDSQDGVATYAHISTMPHLLLASVEVMCG